MNKQLLASLTLFCANQAVFAGENIDIVELSAQQAQQNLQNKTYSSKELTQAFLSRIQHYNPSYNAIISFNPQAIHDAERIDQRRLAGEKLGPLAGIPVVVKDTMNMQYLPTTAGWAPLSAHAGGVDLIPAEDSVVVKRLKDAGAIILGKTNVPILSLSATNANDSWAGPTYNAVDRRLAPGGSSSGTATAVSASFAVLGLGEETGGSIQNPAAAQALVSIKPTFGLVPNVGIFPLASSTRDVVGPHAKNVYDAALVLDVLAGYTPEDPKTVAAIGHIPEEGYTSQLNTMALKGKRIGLYGSGWRNAPLSTETKKLYAQAIKDLKRQGAIIIEDPFAGSAFASIAQLIDIPGIGGYDSRGEDAIAFDLSQYLQKLGPQSPVRNIEEFIALVKTNPFDDPDLLAYIKAQPGFSESLKNPTVAPTLANFIQAKQQYLAEFNKVMNDKKLDALVFPQMRNATPLLDGQDVIADTTVSEINIAGLPGITVPAGYYTSGSPFGLIFVGTQWDEANLLGYAYAYEQATKHRKAPSLTQTQEKN